MKKILGILGGFFLMASISTNTISCSKSEEDYIFNLKTEIGEVIDTFDKRNVIDYYLDYWNTGYKTTKVVINFKTVGLKNYGMKSGDCAYWLEQLVKGLGQKPAQEKYGIEVIPEWAWKGAGLWDYEHNKPKD